MWFKQASLFTFSKPFKMTQQALSDALTPLSFSPCLPSLPSSIGWVSPVDQRSSQLVYGSKRFWMICLQFEEKILPATVVRQAVLDKIDEIQIKEARAVRGKEKQSIKDDVVQTLLPKAFTKKALIYAVIDIERQRLILNSNLPAKTERFIAFFKRAIAPLSIEAINVKKPAEMMTEWLDGDDAPELFTIGQACVLRDAEQERRLIRCQNQDLFAPNIQSFLKEHCEVTQLAMAWKEQVKFTLMNDFSFRSIQFQEAVLALSKSDYTETAEQRFDADFVIMTEMLSQMVDDLLVGSTCAEAVAA